jgi:O-antigen/teichoic acid export membrane protein
MLPDTTRPAQPAAGRHRRPRKSRRLPGQVLGRLSWGVADQAMSSLTNFLIVIYIGRTLGAVQLGAFSLAFVTYGLALNASRGLATDALSVRFSGVPVQTWRRAVANCTGTALVMGLACGICVLAAGAMLQGTTRAAFVALGLVLPGLLLQDSWRFAFFAHGQGSRAFVNDLVWATAQVPAFLFLRISHHTDVFWFVIAWGSAATLGAVIGPWQARVIPRPTGTIDWLRDHRDLGFRFFAQNATQNIANQLRTYSIKFVLGLAALGYLQASNTLLGPFQVIFYGISLVTVPEASRVLRESPRRLPRFCLVIGGALAVAGLAWGLVLLVALPRGVGSKLLGPIWEPAYSLVLPQTLVVIAGGFNAGAGAGLAALAAAQRSLRATVLMSIALPILSIAGAVIGGARGTVYGLALANWFGTLLYWSEFYLAMRERGKASGGRPGESVTRLARTAWTESRRARWRWPPATAHPPAAGPGPSSGPVYPAAA